MTRIRALAALALLALATGCTDDTQTILWRLDMSDADRSRAELVQARVLRGGCGGTEAAYATTLRRSTPTPMGVPSLPAGRWGFAARAEDATCTWFVGGCEEVTLPIGQGAVVVTPLDAIAPEEDSLCGRDGGPGAGIDGGIGDGGTDGATAVDAGPPPPECAAPASWDVSVIWTNEIYVSPSGDDGASGTLEDPIATIDEALGRAKVAGEPTRIVLGPGTYGPSVSARQIGSESAPVRLEGSREAIVDGGGASEALELHQLSHFVFSGFTIANAGHAIRLERDDDGSDHVVVRDVAVRSPVSADGCVRFFDVEGFLIERLDTQGCRNGVRLLGSIDGRIVGSRFGDAPDGSGVSVEGGSSNVLIHHNYFIDLGREAVLGGGDSDITFLRPGATSEAADVWAVANFIRRVGGTDGGAMTQATCDGCVFAHNILVEPRGWVFGILEGNASTSLDPTRNGWFVNNLIFVTPDLDTYVTVGGGRTEPDTFTVGTNMFYSYDDPAFDPASLSSDLAESSPSLHGMDPQIVSRGAGDYHLAAGSPAIGAGRDDVPYGPFAPMGDFDDVCFRSPPSIGGYERY